MKRITLFFIILLLSIPTVVSAETMLNERYLSDDIKEVFIKQDDNYYRKLLEKQDDKWIELENEKITKPFTGIKEDKNITKDKFIEKALEDKLKSKGQNLLSLSRKVDYSKSKHLPPIGLQQENSCLGWSIGYYLRTYQQSKDIGWSVGNNDNHIFSPTFIYNQINGGVDEGAYLEDAGDLLRDVGAAPLSEFPYTPGDYLTQPDSKTISNAYQHRIRDWRVLFTKEDSSDYIIQKTKEYLNTGDLPVVGVDIGMYFLYPIRKPDGNSFITTDTNYYGGHAVAVVGYDDDIETPEGRGAFKIINSWGKEWGSDGFSYITYPAYVNDIIAGYVFTDLVNEEVVEQIVPTQVQDSVEFQMQFSGSGRYDIRIKDNLDNIIKEELNKEGKSGLNKYIWNGKDKLNNDVAQGVYKLELTPYKGTKAKLPFIMNFEKRSKVDIVSAKSYKRNNSIYKVEVNIKAKESGKVFIYIVNGNTEKLIISDDVIIKGENKVYEIDDSKVDFNLDKFNVKIVLE